jgi:type II secretory pathway pseudopilin PulG
MQFRIADVIYLFALFATSFAAFGPLGLFVAMFVEFIWLVILKRLKMTFVELLVVIAIVGTLVGLLIPAGMASREWARRAACYRNLGLVAKALLLTAETSGRLPQAVELDDQNLPQRSWRISVLPRIEQQGIYDAYVPSEPWNGPKNSKILNQSIELFVCPNDPPVNANSPQTNYFAVVGRQTAWPEDRGLALSEITDDRSRTILLLEVAEWAVPWGEPRDLTYDEALNILVGNPTPSARFVGTPLLGPVHPVVHIHYGDIGYFYKKKESARGVHAAFADGTVRFLPVPLPEKMAKALLTANAGDEVEWDEFERLTAPQLDYAKIYAAIAFAIVALWPARRLLRKRPA